MRIFGLEWRYRRMSILLWSLIMPAVVLGFLCLYPSMSASGMQDLMEGALSALPQGMLEAFQLADLPDFTQIDAFFAYIFQYVLLASAILAGTIGASSLVREESEGTIEFLYAQPVTRAAIVTQKMLCNSLLFLIYTALLFLTSLGGIYLFLPQGEDFGALVPRVGMVFAGMLLSCFVFMSAGFFASALLKSHRAALPLTLGTVFLTYFAGIAAQLAEGLSWMQYLSPLHWCAPARLIQEGKMVIDYGIIGSCAILLFVSLSYVWYLNRDLQA